MQRRYFVSKRPLGTLCLTQRRQRLLAGHARSPICLSTVFLFVLVRSVSKIITFTAHHSQVTTTADAVNVKIKAANGRLWADVVLLGGLVPENASAYALNSLLDAGVVSVKAFMCHSGIDDYKAADLHDLEAAMPILAARSVPLMVHAGQ